MHTYTYRLRRVLNKLSKYSRYRHTGIESNKHKHQVAISAVSCLLMLRLKCAKEICIRDARRFIIFHFTMQRTTSNLAPSTSLLPCLSLYLSVPLALVHTRIHTTHRLPYAAVYKKWPPHDSIGRPVNVRMRSDGTPCVRCTLMIIINNCAK